MPYPSTKAPGAAPKEEEKGGGGQGQMADTSQTYLYFLMLIFTPFALCFVTLCGIFMHFPELTY
jgi:hypothetical protein